MRDFRIDPRDPTDGQNMTAGEIDGHRSTLMAFVKSDAGQVVLRTLEVFRDQLQEQANTAGRATDSEAEVERREALSHLEFADRLLEPGFGMDGALRDAIEEAEKRELGRA